MERKVMKGIKNPNVDIKTDGNDIVVTDGKTEYFRKLKTKQTVAIEMIFTLLKSIWRCRS